MAGRSSPPPRRDVAGQAIILFAVGLGALVTLVAVVVNIGQIGTVRTEIQNTVGQAALAAHTRLRECPKDGSLFPASTGGSVSDRGLDLANANAVAGSGLTLDTSEIEVGFTHVFLRTYSEYTNANERHRANTVRIVGRRDSGSPRRPVPARHDRSARIPGVAGVQESRAIVLGGGRVAPTPSSTSP